MPHYQNNYPICVCVCVRTVQFFVVVFSSPLYFFMYVVLGALFSSLKFTRVAAMGLCPESRITSF